MFFFTENEKHAFIVLCIVFIIGTTLQYLIKKEPQLFHLIDAIESTRLYPKINVNTASYESLLELPYIGPATAKAIIDYRENNGGFKNIDELQELYVVRPSNFKKFKHYLTIP